MPVVTRFMARGGAGSAKCKKKQSLFFAMLRAAGLAYTLRCFMSGSSPDVTTTRSIFVGKQSPERLIGFQSMEALSAILTMLSI